MIDLKDYSKDFDPEIRARGETYYWQKRVKTASLVFGEYGHFRVRGTKAYDVHVHLLLHKELATHCTCPYFSQTDTVEE